MMPLSNASPAFAQRYASYLKHLKLQGLQAKTVDAYARAIRTLGEHFDWQIDSLSENQLTDYFHQRIASHSWSAVKLDLYGYKFYVEHVLRQPCHAPADPPAQDQPAARHRHGGTSPGPVCRHPHLKLPGVLLHPVQPGLEAQ